MMIPQKLTTINFYDREHDPGSDTICDLGTRSKSVDRLDRVGVGTKLSGKADSPTALTSQEVAQINVCDGTLNRPVPQHTFGCRSQKCVSEHSTVNLSPFKRQKLHKQRKEDRERLRSNREVSSEAR